MCQIIKSVQFLLWIVMNTVTVMCASICGCSCFYIHVGDSLDLGRKKGSISLCWYTSTPGSRKALDCSYETRKIGLVNNFHCAPIFTQPHHIIEYMVVPTKSLSSSKMLVLSSLQTMKVTSFLLLKKCLTRHSYPGYSFTSFIARCSSPKSGSLP